MVEEEEEMRVMMRYNIEDEGYKVDKMLRGDEEEIEMSERVKDIMIMEWMMKGV